MYIDESMRRIDGSIFLKHVPVTEYSAHKAWKSRDLSCKQKKIALDAVHSKKVSTRKLTHIYTQVMLFEVVYQNKF